MFYSTSTLQNISSINRGGKRMGDVRPLREGIKFGDKVITLKELLDKDIHKPEELLSPWLKKGQLWMVYSKAGIGKTFFALNVAFAVAGGGKYLSWKAEKAQKVLYCDGEMDEWDMQNRLNGILKASKRDKNGDLEKVLKNFFVYSAVGQDISKPFPDLSTIEGLDVLLKKAEGKDFVVIDNIITTMRSGDPNDVTFWTNMQDALVELRKRKTSVLLVHHSNKSGDQMGTSAKDVILDGKIKLEHPSDYSPNEGARWVLDYEKNRGLKGEDVTSVEAQLEEDFDGLPKWTYRMIDHSRHLELKRLAESGEYATAREISVVMEVTPMRISQIKTEAIKDGLFTSRNWKDWLKIAKETKELEDDEETEF